jgi:hypothetical protein
VPRYFFYQTDAAGNPERGMPGDDLDVTGTLTIHDQHGLPIDPFAVASAFQQLMVRHNVLQQRANRNDPFVPASQVSAIADSVDNVVRIRLGRPSGSPHDGSLLSGITPVNAASGLFTLNSADGTASDLTGSISIVRDAPVSDSVEDPARLLLLGPETTGILTGSFAPPPSSGATVNRDYFSVRVVELGTYLRGRPNPNFNGSKIGPRPTVRLNESLNMLAHGNEVLAACDTALSGAVDVDGNDSLVVAPAILGDFEVPAATGPSAVWPQFPPIPATVTPAPIGPLPIALRDSFLPTASLFDDGDALTANLDVILTLNGLPAAAAVRVYHRSFVEDAREERGDGRGGVVPSGGTLSLRLSDPLGLRTPGVDESAILVPFTPFLVVDIVIVKRTGEARVYGNIRVPIATAPLLTADPTPLITNLFTSAAKQAISNAGVLGLSNGVLLPTPPGTNPIEELIDLALSLSSPPTGPATPRDPPRLPTMARQDLLVAGRAGATWQAVLGNGSLIPDIHSNDSRRGSPGGLGGRETQATGIATSGGPLACDIARIAFRSTTPLVSRLPDLATTAWVEPSGLPTGTPGGTFAAVALQTIAPFCSETYFSLLRPLLDPLLDGPPGAVPNDFPAAIDWLINLINTSALSNTVLTGQVIPLLESLRDSDSPTKRLLQEFIRELSTACYGQRETMWALEEAIGNARRFIYIETAGFAATQGESAKNYSLDLIDRIDQRIDAAPGLHVTVCMPKHPNFGPGYEPFADYEVRNRREKVIGLSHDRVVAFHPIGFPGRPSQLEGTTIIVDDVWALVGSSTFRRRGLTFDGGSDLVFTDTNLVEGISPAIRGFRRAIMASRLGIADHGSTGTQPIPTPSMIRLADGVDAFHLIRETLVAGGLGTISRLWNGYSPANIPPAVSTIEEAVANPDGMEFDALHTLSVATLVDLNSF